MSESEKVTIVSENKQRGTQMVTVVRILANGKKTSRTRHLRNGKTREEDR